MRDRLIVALDVPDVSSALIIIEQTHELVGWYKIGLELIASQNADKVIGWAKQFNAKVFYDIKLNDIPTTVGRAVRAARKLGVDLVNVHATAGVAAMRAAVEEAGDACEIAAVTVLTSMGYDELRANRFDMDGHFSSDDAVGALVCDLANLAGCAAVPSLICSPKDLRYLSLANLAGEFKKITPGVRPVWAASDDQKRIMTPAEAIAAGSDRIVVGRPITAPPDGMTSADAAKLIYDEMRSHSVGS